MIRKIINNLLDVKNNTRSFKQIYVQLLSKILRNKKFNDDFNWNIYTIFYSEEIRLGEKINTLKLNINDYKFSKNKLFKVNNSIKPLHDNHKALYESILIINNNDIAEIGCGGGDHLHNLKLLKPDVNIHGYDRSHEQISFLKRRHKQAFDVSYIDITESKLNKKYNLIYTQAVLMHISEKDDRFHNAIINILRSASKYIVLMENWTRHDYVKSFKDASMKVKGWDKIYFHTHSINGPQSFLSQTLIISKIPLKKFKHVYKNICDVVNLNNS